MGYTVEYVDDDDHPQIETFGNLAQAIAAAEQYASENPGEWVEVTDEFDVLIAKFLGNEYFAIDADAFEDSDLGS